MPTTHDTIRTVSNPIERTSFAAPSPHRTHFSTSATETSRKMQISTAALNKLSAQCLYGSPAPAVQREANAPPLVTADREPPCLFAESL
jgi:hypothetical protein